LKVFVLDPTGPPHQLGPQGVPLDVPSDREKRLICLDVDRFALQPLQLGGLGGWRWFCREIAFLAT
jgi:hypothetical protein